MPGAMHRMGVYLGLVEDDEYADADGYGPAPERAPARRDEYADAGYPREKHHSEVTHRSREFAEHPAREHAPREQAPREQAPREYVDGPVQYEEYAQPTYQITALHPRTYNEARTIGEQFRKSTPVIMNLSDMDDADAKRLVDFAAGLTFGLHGRIERVTAKVFLLSPHNVSVTAQDKAKIENGFFNQS
jgi:cell division inhibitor SepF